MDNSQKRISVFCYLLILMVWLGIGNIGAARSQESPKRFVGSEVCKECHEAQYESFSKYSKKSHSFKSVRIMKPGLTDAELKQCYGCHTTGYGQPGGFISETETPHQKNAGCEVCHGPGGLHAESEDPEDIKGELGLEDCITCHNDQRVGAFRYKPMIYGGAH